MTFLKHGPGAAKGQFKCFRCRAHFRSKDGDWHQSRNQQVFLCKPCEKTPEAVQDKARFVLQ